MSTTWKILLPMKRRPGTSVAAFRDYYETRHVPLVMREMGGGIVRYVRRYLDPHPHPETGPCDELPYDVITELWFADEAAFRGTLAYLTTAVMPDDIVADEARFLDRGSFRIVTTVEHETELG